MALFDLIFYTNGKGGVAVSVDGGMEVIVPTGRFLFVENTVWEEDDSFGIEDLNEVQKKLIEEAQLRYKGMNDIEKLAELHKLRTHQART